MSAICSLVIDAHHIITRTSVDSRFWFTSNTPFFVNSAVIKINLNHYLRNGLLYFGTKSCLTWAFSSLCSGITTYFVQTLSNFSSVKTLRNHSWICMANLPYRNEYVKKFSTQIFTAVMSNRGDKGTPLF